jgi:hypothetical protein
MQAGHNLSRLLELRFSQDDWRWRILLCHSVEGDGVGRLILLERGPILHGRPHRLSPVGFYGDYRRLAGHQGVRFPFSRAGLGGDVDRDVERRVIRHEQKTALPGKHILRSACSRGPSSHQRRMLVLGSCLKRGLMSFLDFAT